MSGERIHGVPNAMRTDEIKLHPGRAARVRRELGIPGDAFAVGCISRFHHKNATTS